MNKNLLLLSNYNNNKNNMAIKINKIINNIILKDFIK